MTASLSILFCLIHLLLHQRGLPFDQAEALARNVFHEVSHVESMRFPRTIEDQENLRAALRRRPAVDTLHILKLQKVPGSSAQRDTIHLGYAIVTNVKGKDQPITFGVVLDAQLHIKHVEIVTYREPYGGEVRNASWLEQFVGKGPGDPLQPGRTIRSITGATISVRAVTAGIQDILAAMRIIEANKPAGASTR